MDDATGCSDGREGAMGWGCLRFGYRTLFIFIFLLSRLWIVVRHPAHQMIVSEMMRGKRGERGEDGRGDRRRIREGVGRDWGQGTEEDERDYCSSRACLSTLWHRQSSPRSSFC